MAWNFWISSQTSFGTTLSVENCVWLHIADCFYYRQYNFSNQVRQSFNKGIFACCLQDHSDVLQSAGLSHLWPWDLNLPEHNWNIPVRVLHLPLWSEYVSLESSSEGSNSIQVRVKCCLYSFFILKPDWEWAAFPGQSSPISLTVKQEVCVISAAPKY